MSVDLFQRILDEMTPEEIAALPTTEELRGRGFMVWDDPMICQPEEPTNA